jgi:hypothetical protein
MKRIVVISLFALAAGIFLFAQQHNQPTQHAPLEVRAVFPRETLPGQYQQIDQRELDALAEQGWELVSVMPFVYRNEEHNNGEMKGPKPIVTQTYPAYFFKRVKLNRY